LTIFLYYITVMYTCIVCRTQKVIQSRAHHRRNTPHKPTGKSLGWPSSTRAPGAYTRSEKKI